MASVFLSYDRDDTPRARHFAQVLEHAGHQVWWDLHVRGGAQFSKVIEEALKASDAVVVLWSKNSVESAWVRDEAAAGRDSGRLVPMTIDGTEPPLGFRQYQTIDLSNWKGRSSPPQLAALLADVEALVAHPDTSEEPPAVSMLSPAPVTSAGRRPIPVIGLAVLAILFAAAGAYWFLSGQRSGPPTVAVAAADTSSLSQEMARNLLVKLGSLHDNAATKVRLLDTADANDRADLRFTINGTERNGRIHANGALVSGREHAMLWSKDFEQPSSTRSELDEAVAFAAGRVLGCAIEEASGEHGRLNQELRGLYLSACSSVTEIGWDTRVVLPKFRRITDEAPSFRPAWAKLLAAEIDAISLMQVTEKEAAPQRSQLKADIEAARRLDPDMAEATMAEMALDSDRPIARSIVLINEAKAQDPDNPTVLINRSQEIQRVGAMADALDDARQSAELDPLSPSARANLVLTLIYSGQIDRARAELAKAKQLWPGAQSVRDAELSLELRFGDFEKAARSGGNLGPGFEFYASARHQPSDANVASLVQFTRNNANSAQYIFGLQGLGEMNRPDAFYGLVQRPEDYAVLSRYSYVLFRPWMASVRQDPRFMQLAKRLGLVDYWQKSGEWPDFCSDPKLQYDCKAAAAKLT